MRHTLSLMAMTLAVSSMAQKPLTLDMTVPGSAEYSKYMNYGTYGIFNAETEDFVVWNSDEYSDLLNYARKAIGQDKNINSVRRIYNIYSSKELIVGNSKDIFHINDGRVESILKDVVSNDNLEFNADYTAAAYTSKSDLYITTLSRNIKVNDKSEEGVVYGQSVHRNEFGINGGIFWSNQGNKMAFYRMDESMVTEYPLVDITSREASVKNIRYPMAGETSHEVSVGVFDITKETTIYLKTASPINRYFTNIAWSADDKYILIAELNRDQNHMWMNMYDANTGDFIKTLFEETNPEWVEPQIPALFINNEDFLWISDRDGYRHMYIYNINKNKCEQLTRGEWNIIDLIGYDKKNKTVYFQGNESGFLNKDLYSLKIGKRNTIRRLTSGEGIHNITMSPNYKYFVDKHSSPQHAINAVVCAAKDGSTIETIKNVKNPYEGFTMPTINLVKLRSADNKYELPGRIILPSNFDSNKKYPVIVYLYGGPHSQLVNNSWLYGANTWMLSLAEKGYIVFTMDNRGTENRGVAFEHAIYRHLGREEMSDQMQGIQYLRSLEYVDANRIGIHGWSFGGFMTISMMLNNNQYFKAGVAGGPVCDWSLYEVMYGERYMDTPQDNKNGYAENNISEQTENLKGRLLVIHGDIDNTVVWQHSLRLLQDAVKKDVLIDYSVYPQHEHNVLGPDRVHLFKKIFQYFDDNL